MKGIGNIPKYAWLGLMRIQGKQVISHTVGNEAKRIRIELSDILNYQAHSMLKRFEEKSEGTSDEFENRKIELRPEERELSVKEAAQLIWYSFRFSNGSAGLQFTMLHQAFQKYGPQKLDPEEVLHKFYDRLGIGCRHVEFETHHNPSGYRPPHPTTFTTEKEISTDMKLSVNNSHKKVRSEDLEESIELIKMLLHGDGEIYRESTDRDIGIYSISSQKNLENIGGVIEIIFGKDFGYLVKEFRSSYDYEHKGRPNRLPEHDGENNLKDRYFSYLVWYVIKGNSTGNSFFDEYFRELHKNFNAWFQSLPSDEEVIEINRKGKEKNPVYNNKSSYRKDNGYSTQIIKEDILVLIARYNIVHPNTQVNIEELV